jgi:hypothetical protein
VPLSLDDARLPAARPRWSVLGSARGVLLGTVENAICHYLAVRGAPTPAAPAHAPQAEGVAA